MTHESIHELFSLTAQKFPDALAVDAGRRRIAYGELDAKAEKLARVIRAAGVGRGSVVGIFTDDPIEVIGAIIGILKAGCVFCPLDPNFPDKRLELMIGIASPQCFVTEPRFEERLRRIAGQTTSAAKLILGETVLDGRGNTIAGLNTEADGGNAEFDAARSDPDGMCSIYFTSGSTGRPKAIAGRLKGISHFARWEIDALHVGEGTRVSQLASPAFDGFLKDAFVPLCAGGTVCAPESREIILDAGRLIDWLDVEGIEVLHCVPSVFRAMLNEGLKSSYFPELKYVVLAGEPLLAADVRRWMGVFGERVQLVNLYGPTETTVTKLYHFVRAEDLERASIPIGKPMPGAAAMILDSAARPCPSGVIGEIYIRTPYCALGYYGEPELTKESFIPNPFGDDPSDIVYRTGDFGRLLEDGSFEYLGRRDQQVKVRGVRVELGEIENLLREHPGVADVAVTDRDDAEGNKFLCAYYVAAAAELKAGELRGYLSERVPEYMLPSAYVEMGELPRTLNGKLDRRALPSLEQVREERGAEEATTPRTPVEEIVAGVWAEVLRLPVVGAADNFFELGGHSLLATRIISRLREALGVELQLRDLFEWPTVGELARRVEALAQGGEQQGGEAIMPAPRDGELPLSFSQQRLWFLHQLSGNSAAYNIPLGMRLEGVLNVGVLEQTLGEIVRRHEVLRTTFPARDGAPVQVISPAQRLYLPLLDLSGLPEDEREAEAQKLATQDGHHPFDLATGPLVRLLLIRLSQHEHVLISTMHHLVGDAWSFDVLAAEISRLYESFNAGRPSLLPELPIQYADYAAWQRQWLQGDVLETRLRYWRRQLEGAPAQLNLPLSRPRPTLPSFRGARLVRELSEELSERLRVLSRREGVTLYMTLLAGFLALLHQYSGEEDVVVGSVIANRERPEVEGLIGFLANTLVLRVGLGGDPTFRELLGRVREVCLGGYAHQLPPELLVGESAVGRGASRGGMYQVWFQFETAVRETLELGGVKWSGYKVERGDARFELSLVLEEWQRGIVGELEYDVDLFSARTVSQMLEDYVALIERMVAEPDSRIATVELTSQQESAELSWGFSVNLDA